MEDTLRYNQPPMDVEIRRAMPEAAEELTAIAIASKGYWGYPERWMQIWKPELTYRPDYVEKSEIWAAVMDHTLIGFYTLLEKDGQAWLEDLWVLPARMGNGIGRALFLHACRLSKGRGYRIMRWESDPNALGFYVRMGAHQIGERHSEVEGQLRSLPIMELDL